MRLLERVENRFALGCVESLLQGKPRSGIVSRLVRCGSPRELKILDFDLVAGSKRNRTLEDVFQLADVARKIILGELRLSLRRQPRRLSARALALEQRNG